MFDCPEQTQTSPTKTLTNATTFFPDTISWKGPPALSGSSLIIHFPSLPALTVLVCSSNVTVIFSPAFAHPQIGIGIFLCNTMLSPKIFGNRTLAKDVQAINSNKENKKDFFIQIGRAHTSEL